ncbi:alpha/beta fold hydrolase [Rhodopila globiformis]|uniref:Alpha/beta hydrolase n=1 Tax=Rhodopila globiformis TaxID=1071 RepID=A0A2S6NGL6_RHOGL|nr:alpha/beta hydrolase [Rhodopila globiformis]PPQ33709.1 alpha/beta hydrolase [Rhodopila globiformis]
MISRRLVTAAMTLLPMPLAWARPPLWLELPPTPTLPETTRSGYAPVNGIRLWHAVFGQGEPVVFLHGGLANANYWGLQVPVVAKQYQVIVLDSRGHGRSTRDNRPYGYDLMADDVIGLLDYLKVPKAAVVGWSDGGILGLDLAIRHPERVTKVFAFAANSDPSGVVNGVEKNPTFARFIARAGLEYRALSTTPNEYQAFVDAISRMWATQPNWTTRQLAAIRTPTLVADGDHDEAIKRPHTEYLAASIPGAGLLILPETSHFSFLQDPDQFTWHVLHFLGQPA